MSCSYQSITLQPGEVFVLPPNATLIAATDTGTLSAENNCLNLSYTENFECYAVMMVETQQIQPQDDSPAYQDIYIKGIRIGEINYPFTSTLQVSNWTVTQDLRDAIDSTPLGPIIIDLQALLYDGTNDHERAWKVAFKTVPSIAGNHTKMSFYADASPGNSGIGSFEIEFDVVPYADRFQDDAGMPYPDCTTT